MKPVLGTFTVSSNTTVSNPLFVPAGAIYSVASGITLTIDGPFSAGLYQVFSGAGSVVFTTGTVSNGYIEWWGAASTGAGAAAANSVAIQAAITSGVSILLSPGNFFYDTTLVLQNDSYIVGVNKYSSHLTYTGVGDGITGVSGTRLFRILLEKFLLTTNNAANAGTGIKLEEYDSYCRIEEVLVYYFGLCQIHLTGMHNVIRKPNVIGRSLANGGVTYGIRICPSTTTSTIPTTTLLEHCYVSNSQNAGTDAIGISWESPYKCYEKHSIIETADIGRNVNSAGSAGFLIGLLSVIETYYEGVTTNQVWHNTGGYVIGYGDPNITATWDWAPAGNRYIRYFPMLTSTASTVGSRAVFGSASFAGASYFPQGIRQGYYDREDENTVFDTESLQVVGVAPTTGRTYTLSTAVGKAGMPLRIVFYGPTGSGKTLSINPDGAETISGASSYVLRYQGEHVTLISDGANWQVIEAGGIKQSAIADGTLTFTGTDAVSKADIVLLQAEVNKLKLALRTFGIIKL